ncbi:hypothetical protein MYXO_00563 [Myxococcaceae bacterium]|jgi:hypothetical protein|nr:hypothetical protein MYXO_00563 [Myxococcaceae bacterium]
MRIAMALLISMTLSGVASAQSTDMLNKAAKGAIDAVLPPGEKPAEGARPGKDAAPPKPGDMVSNPAYEAWAPYAVGASVTIAERIEFEDGSVVIPVTTSKLVSKSADRLTVESVSVAGAAAKHLGAAEETKSLAEYPAKIKYGELEAGRMADARVTEGKELVDVAGKEVEASFVETRYTAGGETVVEKVWNVADVPGHMAKKTVTKKKGEKTSHSASAQVKKLDAKKEAASK